MKRHKSDTLEKTFVYVCVCVCVVRLHEEEEEVESEEKKLLPHKHDIISVLGVGGHWVTSHQDLQVSWGQTQQRHHKLITS